MLSGLMGGCGITNEPEVQLQQSYKELAPISLNVTSIDVISANKSKTGLERHNQLLFAEVEKWARERFLPAGQHGTAVVKISDLSIVESPLSGGKGNLFASRKDQYMGTLAIRVSINDAVGFEKSYVENQVKRSVIVPSSSSLLERENKVKLLIMEMIHDLDAQLSINIKEHLGYNLAF